jgi:hypothetical protein
VREPGDGCGDRRKRRRHALGTDSFRAGGQQAHLALGGEARRRPPEREGGVTGRIGRQEGDLPDELPKPEVVYITYLYRH